MLINNIVRYATGKNKSFVEDYVCCDQCEWNGVPNQKIVGIYLGIRPANEPGFIYKYETYDYSQDGTKGIHQHKYDPDVIDQILDPIFDRIERMVE
jgi:hypothetical protein